MQADFDFSGLHFLIFSLFLNFAANQNLAGLIFCPAFYNKKNALKFIQGTISF